MCGIFGFISSTGKGPDIARLRHLALVTQSRGRPSTGSHWSKRVVLLPEPLVNALATANRPTLTLVKAPPGAGKSHAVQHALATHKSRTLYVAPTHDLARQVHQDLQDLGVTTHYWRQGPDDQDECPERDLVEFFRGMGYMIRLGPCLKCFRKKKCTYRRVFTCRANRQAQVLIVTSWHLRRSDLWGLKAMLDRPLVVLDEDAMSALAAPVELTVERLQMFDQNLQALRDVLGGETDGTAWLVRRRHKPADGDGTALALTDILRRTALLRLRRSAREKRPISSESDLDLCRRSRLSVSDESDKED